ncbi:protein HEADING DATE 3A-like [Hibiscus syriacus]|uniref:Protein HEADING DATE 3A-like n=1 Tax=Hibiscus syriacus TaxID=106335 RepID=A0A6A2WM74_HIBSY|nr:protein HEADING DATE 3A-like [Hibiscus syriacus]
MENGGAEKVHGDGNGNGQTAAAASYTYWVREATADAAPLPLPKKLIAQDLVSNQSQLATLGSVWNRAGTWEEKNLNSWATQRLKELFRSVAHWTSRGKAEISDVTKCDGDRLILFPGEFPIVQAFLVTVRNKKRVGEWHIQEEKKTVKGHIDIPEFSYGELDDLQMEVKLSEEKEFVLQDKQQIVQDLKKLFLQPVREKLLQFEQELKDR